MTKKELLHGRAYRATDFASTSSTGTGYIRVVPDILVIMAVNPLVVLAMDHRVHFQWWRHVAKSSLGRQTTYNSTSNLREMRYDLHTDDGPQNQDPRHGAVYD
ncbi:unnamed protein product [Aphanomyces euteiches]